MDGSSDIPHVDTPYTLLELASLADLPPRRLPSSICHAGLSWSVLLAPARPHFLLDASTSLRVHSGSAQRRYPR